MDLSNSEYKRRSKVSIITEERDDLRAHKYNNEPKNMENDKFMSYDSKEENKITNFEKGNRFAPAKDLTLGNPLQDRPFVKNHWKTENFHVGNILGRGKFSNVYLAK